LPGDNDERRSANDDNDNCFSNPEELRQQLKNCEVITLAYLHYRSNFHRTCITTAFASSVLTSDLLGEVIETQWTIRGALQSTHNNNNNGGKTLLKPSLTEQSKAAWTTSRILLPGLADMIHMQYTSFWYAVMSQAPNAPVADEDAARRARPRHWRKQVPPFLCRNRMKLIARL